MKKINRIGIKEILAKRHHQINEKAAHNKTDTDCFLLAPKTIQIEGLIQKIANLEVDGPSKCELSSQQKIAIIEFISEKQNISLNAHALVQNLIVWKVPQESELVLLENTKKSIFKSDNSQNKNSKNFYVIKGSISIYKKYKHLNQGISPSKNKDIKESAGSRQNSDKQGFATETQQQEQQENLISSTFSYESTYKTEVKKFEPTAILEQMSGFGWLFGQKSENVDRTLVASSGIYVEIKNLQVQGMAINLGGMDQTKKLNIISKFPIFKQINKKIQNIIPFIELKNYTRSQFIYRSDERPTAVYLIIKGEVVFQIKTSFPKKKINPFTENELQRQQSNDIYIQTEKLGVGNYFGEEEVLEKSQHRKMDALCYSSDCSLLQIPFEKFQKLMAYSDFVQELRINAESRISQRKQKLKKSTGVHLQYKNKSENDQTEENAPDQKKTKSAAKKKRSTQPIMMHGKIIRKVPDIKGLEGDINFSMLHANPDMYNATLKKFRKFTMKQPQKKKPQVNWKLKRVWKVLNLENILREDIQVTSPEGKIFFESHRRLQNHVNQVKSIRPKTSSSTYRTKLQYIAYLQQFND